MSIFSYLLFNILFFVSDQIYIYIYIYIFIYLFIYLCQFFITLNHDFIYITSAVFVKLSLVILPVLALGPLRILPVYSLGVPVLTSLF